MLIFNKQKEKTKHLLLNIKYKINCINLWNKEQNMLYNYNTLNLFLSVSHIIPLNYFKDNHIINLIYTF